MKQNLFQYADDLGPEKIVAISNPKTDLRAIVVIDNVARGPAMGGCRMAPDVTLEECFRLARAMTLKNAAAGLAHGGGKSVIIADPRMPSDRKEAIIRAFAHALRDLREYIVGPDMGTNERDMARINDESGRSVGLPREIGGIPLDEIGATGFGVAIAAEVAQEFCSVKLVGARVAIQGFGAVGKHAARFLGARGATLVAASDSTATVTDPRGLDLAELIAFKDGGGHLADYTAGKRMDRDEIVGVECDIWIPAARPDVVTMKNVESLRTHLILQGANIPISTDAEARLHQRGVLIVPDFIANAGGVICAAVEYQRGTEAIAMQTIEQRIRENTRAVLAAANNRGVTPREAAMGLARERVASAMNLRRF